MSHSHLSDFYYAKTFVKEPDYLWQFLFECA